MMYSAALLPYTILKQRGGVPKNGKGADGHGVRERLLTIHLLEPSIKVRTLAEKKQREGAHGAEREIT